MTVDHPILGDNDLPQIVKLTALHEQRHQEHIRTILKKLPASVAPAA
jgi:hypothetical protein